MDGGVAVGLLVADHTMTMRACSCVDAQAEQGLQALLGRAMVVLPGTVAAEALRRREPLLLGREATEKLQPPFADLARELDLGSLAIAPLVGYGRPIGWRGTCPSAAPPPLA